MKPFRWSPDKNDTLKVLRGVSFEDVTVAVESGGLVSVVPHPQPNAAHAPTGPRQKIMVVEVFGYACLVPYAEEEDHFFLTTIIPSRTAARKFMGKETSDD